MTDTEETAYMQGSRSAWLSVLSTALRNLGYDSTETQHAAWIIEREEAVQKLRGLCREHGDNDWPDELSLADIIEKHLGDYLDESPNQNEVLKDLPFDLESKYLAYFQAIDINIRTKKLLERVITTQWHKRVWPKLAMYKGRYIYPDQWAKLVVAGLKDEDLKEVRMFGDGMLREIKEAIQARDYLK